MLNETFIGLLGLLKWLKYGGVPRVKLKVAFTTTH